MKNANQIARSSVAAIREAEKTPATSLNEEAKNIVNGLFKSLQAAKPGWRASFPDDESLRLAKSTFVKGLIEAQVTDRAMISLGMKKARLDPSQFFPSIGQFIMWCKPEPEDFGMPPASLAWRECCDNCHRKLVHVWSHPAVYESGKRIGWYEIRCGKATLKPFELIYQKTVDEVMAGAEFVVPKPDATRLEYKGGRKTRTEQSKIVGKEHLQQIKECFR